MVQNCYYRLFASPPVRNTKTTPKYLGNKQFIKRKIINKNFSQEKNFQKKTLLDCFSKGVAVYDIRKIFILDITGTRDSENILKAIIYIGKKFTPSALLSGLLVRNVMCLIIQYQRVTSVSTQAVSNGRTNVSKHRMIIFNAYTTAYYAFAPINNPWC